MEVDEGVRGGERKRGGGEVEKLEGGKLRGFWGWMEEVRGREERKG